MHLTLDPNYFDLDRLLIDLPLLQFDFRFERKESENKINDYSIGSIVTTIGFASLGKVAPEGGILSKIEMGGWQLASGLTKYILFENKIFGL